MEHPVLGLVDATIAELQQTLARGTVSCVDLAAAYLDRISAYDCRGPSLNSVPIINTRVFEEAAASDDRRASGNTLGPLDGIPFTVKDSYKVKGLSVASGSPAFQDLIANEDAFTVGTLRKAGAILIGKTNMCPMAAGGMQRGVYGRAESPYNPQYLAAAFASGSSNGSGVATAASLAAFGMGEETVSSGRSPASNNALVAYTPSRGAISIRGNWPLYATCDVVVPHTRCVEDLLAVLEVITAEDKVTSGDFWRDQNFIQLTRPWKDRNSKLCETAKGKSLRGTRIAVPSMYIGRNPSEACLPHVDTCTDVVSLYQQARLDLEAQGAVVVEVDDFPILEKYELANTSPAQLQPQYHLPAGWHTIERSTMVAYAWEQFLRENDDVNISSLQHVDSGQIYPSDPPDCPQVRYAEPANRIHYEKLRSFIEEAEWNTNGGFDPRSKLMSIPDLKAALQALEALRRDFFEDWLTANSFDFVAFPACGDVGKSDADMDYSSAEYAWRNGVKYSNGNRCLRHVGIPSITVPMGVMAEKAMPVGLTFLNKSGNDMDLLQMAYTYEQATKRRTVPNLTPALGPSLDVFMDDDGTSKHERRQARPDLRIEKCTATPASPRAGQSQGMLRVNVHGCVTFAKGETAEDLDLEICIDSKRVPKEKIVVEQCHGTTCGRSVFDFRSSVIVPEPPPQDERNRVLSRKKIARDSTMVVITAREGMRGWKSGFVKLL